MDPTGLIISGSIGLILDAIFLGMIITGRKNSCFGGHLVDIPGSRFSIFDRFSCR